MDTNIFSFQAQGVTVAPGDKLILGFNRQLDDEELDNIAQVIKSKAPDVDILVIDQVATMGVIKA